MRKHGNYDGHKSDVNVISGKSLESLTSTYVPVVYCPQTETSNILEWAHTLLATNIQNNKACHVK